MFITTLGHISLGVFLAMHGSPAVAGIISNGMLVSGLWAEAYNHHHHHHHKRTD